MSDTLAELTAAGVSLWLDDLSRERLRTGNLAALIADKHITGVTSNPTIFAKALSDGAEYAAQVSELAARGADVDAAARTLMTDDVRNACDLFAAVNAATSGIDGRVSIEVEPGLAHDTDGTIAQARELVKIVDRPNLYVKIPATEEGIPAIAGALAEGISINVTLIFSLQRYDQVIEAFFSGMERAKENGHDLSKLTSVASFFVSRVDTEVDKRLDAIGTPEAAALRGKAAIANARLAYQLFEQRFSGPRWEALQAAGARVQRPLWASTGVKDPTYDDTRYVVELVVADTVNTAPEKTIDAVADHGVLRGDTVHGTYAESRQVFDDLAALGVDLDDVFAVLEREGVEKFDASWAELQATVRDALAGGH
ncbi:MAG TPA: transaldolase [Nakamurella sp.]|nr:transaldolase [Nakamurella sp.]